ncbi:MAG: glycogen debranching protein [Bacteroidota bacterium]
MKTFLPVLLFGLFCSCTQTKMETFATLLESAPKIEGKTEYLDSPYVTAGDRVYMVGHQNGTFPELGWHIKGEMGGIWNHPIKLMDGFEAKLKWGDLSTSLDTAERFTNFPMANTHSFQIPEKEMAVERWQFVPDGEQGIVIHYVLKNNATTTQDLDFEFTGHTDLRPTWLGERTAMKDAKDTAQYATDFQGWLAKDGENPWFVGFGSDIPPDSYTASDKKYQGLGIANHLSYALQIAPKSATTLTFYIAGSYTAEKEVVSTLEHLKKEANVLLSAKQQRYAILAGQSKLTIPDPKMQQAFEWLKYNCDWLVRTVPEVGTGIGAGIPDYPWWFGVDSEYALQGYMAIGQKDIVYKTIALLDSVSNAVNGNGKIIHEMATNGAVFNPGNINETPQYASLLWSVYQWTGDQDFLERYFPTVEKGMQWLMDANDADGNGFPEGFGMMEIHGLDSEMIDVAAYSQKGFADAAQMAQTLGKEGLAIKYSAIAAGLKTKINRQFWSEDFNSYADFIGTDEQALHLIEDAIVRADTLDKPWAIEELEATRKFIEQNPSQRPRPFVMHHNWVVNTPMEVGIADTTKALKALETAKQFVNPFGVFVTGIDRDASAGSDEGAYKAPPIFTYTGAVMTLPTGVQARAENNYGRPNEALKYLERMTRSFSYALPGSMYEVSPDFGMMVQAWNIYSFAYPIVQQFFGIHPDAANKTVVIRPQMPDKWDEASLESVGIGDNKISVFYSKKGDDLNIRITQTNPEWKLILELPGKERIIGKGDGIQFTL